MPSYLVETFLAHGADSERRERQRQARAAAEALTRGGADVRYRGSIHVPDDELCYFAFQSPSRRLAAQAAERAGLEPLRMVRATVSIDDRGRRHP